MKHWLIYLFVIFFTCAIELSAQDTSNNQEQDSLNVKSDTTIIEFGGDYLKMKFLRLKPFKTIYTEIYNDEPSININYGLNQVNYERKIFTSDINNNGIYEITFGSTSLNKSEASLVEYENDYLSFAVAQKKFNYNKNGTVDNTVDLKHIKLGLTFADGYGWDLGSNLYFVFYHSSGINWNHLKFYESNADTASLMLSKVFGKQIRYGRGFSGGMRIFLMKGIALNAEYEQFMTFPRHLFWKDAGAWLIEASAQGLADIFINKIIDNAPNYAPIMHFLLKNGISLGFYELYKEKMYWPFKSNPPLMTKSYKVGLEFIF